MADVGRATACWGCGTGAVVLRDEFGHPLCRPCAARYEITPEKTTPLFTDRPVRHVEVPAPAAA